MNTLSARLRPMTVILAATLFNSYLVVGCVGDAGDQAPDHEFGIDSLTSEKKSGCGHLSGAARAACKAEKQRIQKCRTACNGDIDCKNECNGGGGSREGEDESCPSEALYNWSRNLWPNPRNIPVCLWDADPSSESAQLTRQIVTAEYGKLGFRFSGWRRCGSDDKCSIRLSLDPSYEFGLADWGYGCDNGGGWTVGWTTGAANARYYALHEFGHVLGMGGDFDQPKCTSVMSNYCEIKDFGATLTECDIRSIRKAYGL